MPNTIAKQNLMGKANIEFASILDSLYDKAPPSKVTHPLNEIWVNGKIYKFSITAEEIIRGFKIGDRGTHCEYGSGTVSRIKGIEGGVCYSKAGAIFVIFDRDIPADKKRLYFDDDSVLKILL